MAAICWWALCWTLRVGAFSGMDAWPQPRGLSLCCVCCVCCVWCCWLQVGLTNMNVQAVSSIVDAGVPVANNQVGR